MSLRWVVGHNLKATLQQLWYAYEYDETWHNAGAKLKEEWRNVEVVEDGGTVE